MNPIIFRDISHYYDTEQVLNKINLSFEKNKITVILGRSGSGKSTLLQMINGLLIPSKGFIKLFGEKLNYGNIYQLRRAIGYSVQGTGLFPHLTVYENIALLIKVSGQDHLEQIDNLLEMVDLDLSYKGKYPHQLSGGEQQRVGICRAMILDPPIFLLDEAFGALDVATRRELQQELLKLQKVKPRTIVLVTHDVGEAFILADKILILNDGEVQQYANPMEIKNNPSNSFVEQIVQI